MTREIQALASIIDSLGPPRKVASHPPKYRRASVAIIIRVRPNHQLYAQHNSTSSRRSRYTQQQHTSTSSTQSTTTTDTKEKIVDDPTKLRPIQAIEHPESIDEFFEQDWVQTGTPEILFIERATRKTDRWSGHVALPGGKQELHEDDQETAARETLEEIGLDLSDPSHFRCVGQLDDRELWTSFGRVFLMVLSPFGKSCVCVCVCVRVRVPVPVPPRVNYLPPSQQQEGAGLGLGWVGWSAISVGRPGVARAKKADRLRDETFFFLLFFLLDLTLCPILSFFPLHDGPGLHISFL